LYCFQVWSRFGVSNNNFSPFSAANSTDTLLQGKAWEAKLPGYANHQCLCRCVVKLQDKEYPHGVSWTGEFPPDNLFCQIFIGLWYI
jgi:hypothetical protein